MSDEELFRLIQLGEEEAFTELYSRYSRRLLAFFVRMLGGEDQAQDFLQELFLRVIQKQHTFNHGKRFSTWIFSIAYNMCKNEYRRREVRKASRFRLEEDSVQNAPSVETKVEMDIFLQLLEQELQKLLPEQRAVFLMRFQEGFSLQEIATVLQCPIGTVKSRLHYAARKLAKLLQEFQPDIRKENSS